MMRIRLVLFALVASSGMDLVISNGIPKKEPPPIHRSNQHLFQCLSVIYCDKKVHDKMMNCISQLDPKQDLSGILRKLKMTLKTETTDPETLTDAYCKLDEGQKKPIFNEITNVVKRKHSNVCSNAYKIGVCNNWDAAIECCWNVVDEVFDLNLC